MGGSAQQSLSRESVDLARTQGNKLDSAINQNLHFLQSVLGDKFGSNWNALPGEVSRGFDVVRANTEKAYQNAQFSSDESVKYLAKTSGENFSGGQVRSAMAQNARALDTDRRQALGQIQLEEANAGLSANNALMRLFTGAGQTALGLATSYQSQANQAASMVSNVDPWGAALGGAAAGASAGGVIPGWGTVIGGLVGGAMGYLSAK